MNPKVEEAKAVFTIIAATLFTATHRTDTDDKQVCEAAIKRAKMLASMLDQEFLSLHEHTEQNQNQP